MSTAALVAGGLLAAGWAAGRVAWRRRAARWRRLHPPGPDGLVPGAQPIAFDGGPRAALLLHGFGDTPQTVAAIATALRDRGWTVRAPLLPGHGRSLEAFASSRASQWSAAVATAHGELLRAHPRVAIVGLSLGAALAVPLAARATPTALVLLAPFVAMPGVVRAWSRWWPLWQLVQPYIAARAGASILDPGARQQSLGYGVSTPHQVHEIATVVDAAGEALPRVSAPVLVVASTHDYRVDPDAVRRAVARVASHEVSLLWVEHSGHVITVDHDRDEVTRRTVEWLERWSPAAS